MQSHAQTIQTYGLFVHDQRNTRSIHSTNEDQRRAIIVILRSVFDQQNGACMKMTLPEMHYDLILTASRTNN